MLKATWLLFGKEAPLGLPHNGILYSLLLCIHSPLLCGVLHAAIHVELNVSLSLEEPGEVVEVQMTEAMAL